MRRYFSCLPLFLLLLACSPAIRYTGKTYPATSRVDVFFEKKEIHREFEIMGQFEYSSSQSSDFNKTLTRIKEEAMKKGADAVIISGVVIHSDSKPDSTAAEKGGDLINQNLTVAHSLLRYNNTESKPSNDLSGEFIRYK